VSGDVGQKCRAFCILPSFGTPLATRSCAEIRPRREPDAEEQAKMLLQNWQKSS
jgi:hypothetical protein